MQERIKSLYVAIVDNEVVCFDTNLKDFHIQLQELAKGCRNYDYFYRAFRKFSKIEYTDNDGNSFYIQKIL